MNIVLWILQSLVGLAFIVAGLMKTFASIERLATQMAWVKDFPTPFVRFIGFVEFLGGVGLIVPAATGILPWLTPVAAIGLAVIMLSAAIYHLQKKDLMAKTLPSVVFLVFAVVIVVGRYTVAPL
jgi:putative oxidoreductase